MTIEARSQLYYLRENFCDISSTCQPLWHPLGFVSCVIRKEESVLTTRIHYWPKLERRTKNPNWPIHNHTYDLSSYILDGQVRDTQYRLTVGDDYVVYLVSYFEQNSTITRTEKQTSVETTINTLRTSGEEYSVPLGVFHQTNVLINESAMSLVVLSNFADDKPHVLGSPGKDCYPYDRMEFDKSQFWDRVSEVINRH